MIISLEDLKTHLNSPRPLMIAGKEETLKKIPRGNWIGGTIPYLIPGKGHEIEGDFVDLTILPKELKRVKVKRYTLENIHEINLDAYEKGFTYFIIPAESKIHHSFAMNSRDFHLAGKRPIIGWVSGYSLENETEAKVIYGPTGQSYSDRAVALHCKLPENRKINFDVINLFEPGHDDILEFPHSGFSVEEVIVNGEKQKFIDYIQNNNIDMTLPLVSTDEEYKTNVSFKKINGSVVELYAPVFDYYQYRIALPVKDYYKVFSDRISQKEFSKSLFTCNCILNYQYADLTDKKLDEISGPITFGEIANNLQNQTFVSMCFYDKKSE